MKLQFKDNEERNSFIKRIAQEDICPRHMGFDQFVPDDCIDLSCERCWELVLEKSSGKPKIVKLSELHLWDKFYDPDDESWVITKIFDDSVEVTKSHLLKKIMNFGKTNNYAESNYKEFLNTEYIKEAERKFGSENILNHSVDLTSMDGFKDYGFVEDKVTMRSFDQYRKGAKYFELEDCVESLATPSQTPKRNDTSYVMVVGTDGCMNCIPCGWYSGGVRPVLHLRSSINALNK